MMRFIALSRAVCTAQVAFFALGSAPALAAGPVPFPVPAVLAVPREEPGRFARVDATGAPPNDKVHRSPLAPFVEADRWTLQDDSWVARALVTLDEASTAPKITVAGSGGTSAGQRIFPDQRSVTLKVLDRRFQISRVTVTRQRMEVVFTTRF